MGTHPGTHTDLIFYPLGLGLMYAGELHPATADSICYGTWEDGFLPKVINRRRMDQDDIVAHYHNQYFTKI